MLKKPAVIRITVAFLSMLLILSFTACKQSSEQAETSGTTKSAGTTSPTTEAQTEHTEEESSSLISPERLVIKAWMAERIDAPVNI
jgi:hypothetical protein